MENNSHYLTWTYNFIWCVVAIPVLGFLIRKWIGGIEATISSLCGKLDATNQRVDREIAKLDEQKRNKEVCEERMGNVTKTNTDLAKAMDDLWERVNHHRHQKENGGIVIP